MQLDRRSLLAGTAALLLAAPAQASGDISAENDGRRDFDFLVGNWKVHHRRLKDRRVGSTEWQECEGTCSLHNILGGLGNFDENVIQAPKGTYSACTIRLFDPVRKLWSIYWLDSRYPGPITGSPMEGGFKDGKGLFFDEPTVIDGKSVQTRFIWSPISKDSARWEQAESEDGGKSWETNWIMSFQRSI
jgi:hypothetical protein